jgi:hypothetical protein
VGFKLLLWEVRVFEEGAFKGCSLENVCAVSLGGKGGRIVNDGDKRAVEWAWLYHGDF